MVEDCGRWLDSSTVPVTVSRNGEVFCRMRGHFFGMSSQLDETEAPDGESVIALEDRYWAAAFAAAVGGPVHSWRTYQADRDLIEFV